MNIPPLKITTIGDGMIGKTCLLITYTKNEFPKEYVPTVYDNHTCSLTVDSKDFALTLWDTAGMLIFRTDLSMNLRLKFSLLFPKYRTRRLWSSEIAKLSKYRLFHYLLFDIQQNILQKRAIEMVPRNSASFTERSDHSCWWVKYNRIEWFTLWFAMSAAWLAAWII